VNAGVTADGTVPGRHGAGLTVLLAAMAGLGAANLYYAQPMVGLIGAEFRLHGAAAAQVSTAAQVGYMVGIVLLVPLGDLFDRRRLIIVLTAALVLSLLAAAAAPNLAWLLAASVAIGVSATLAQQAVPLAASLASPAVAGRAVGQVLSGLLVGILFARTLSGLVAEHSGWRAMYGLGALIAAALMGAAWFGLPTTRPITPPRYTRLLASVYDLVKRHGVLRAAAAVQGLLFAGFNAFWAVLALHVQQPPFGMGPAGAGLFGLLGLTGVLIAPAVGRMVDHQGPWRVGSVGVVLVLSGWAVAGVLPGLPGLVLAVALLDAGLQTALVSNQAAVFALDQASRSRINAAFVAAIFLGGALGSACGSLAWYHLGWPGVLLTGAGFTATALAVQVFLQHRTRR